MQRIKCLALLSAVLLGALAVGQESRAGNVAIAPGDFTEIAATGGIDGGGGGTIIPEPVDAWRVKRAIREVKPILNLWLNEEEEFARVSMRGRESELDNWRRRFFLGQRTIFDVLDELVIEAREEGGCLDLNGDEWDASIVSDIPGAICMSVERLAQKLDVNNFEYQTAALILHEASHLLGIQEEEAHQLQRFAVFGLRSISVLDADIWLKVYVQGFIKLDLNIEMMMFQSDVNRVEGFCGAAEDFRDKFFQFNSKLRGERVYLKTQRAAWTDHFQDQHIKFWAIEAYLCSRDTSVEQVERDRYRLHYERGFGGTNIIDARIFANRFYEFEEPVEPSLMPLMLSKIRSKADVQAQLEEIKAYYMQVYENIETLRTGEFSVEVR